MYFHKVLIALTMTSALLGTAHATPDADKARADIKAAFGFVPAFLKAYPDAALPGAWQMLSGFELNAKTALSGKTKDLIGLAVAAQIPCRYCIYADTEFAKLEGATQDEIGVTVAEAAVTRQWSTVINGFLPDEAGFRAMVDKWVAFAKGGAPQAPPLTDPVLAEIAGAFGSVPDFVAKYPLTALPGSWRQLRDVELSDKTSVDPKTKSLIGIAVAAQIPCRFCLIADTAFARLQGASDEEIAEAITVSAMARNVSTFLNGLQVDEAQFRRDVDHIVRDARKTAHR